MGNHDSLYKKRHYFIKEGWHFCSVCKHVTSFWEYECTIVLSGLCRNSLIQSDHNQRCLPRTRFFWIQLFFTSKWTQIWIHTYCHKTSACNYFRENKASIMIYSHLNVRLKFLSIQFCLNWRKLILKVFKYIALQNSFSWYV